MHLRLVGCWLVILTIAFISLSTCSAKEKSAKSVAAALDSTSSVKSADSKKRFAALGSPKQAEPAKKAAFSALGGPKKSTTDQPKFALRTDVGMAPGVGGNAVDRESEVKRLISAYEGIALRYSDGLVLAKTPEEKAAWAPRAPSARALSPIAVLVAHLVAVDPTDEPALDAMVFLSKFLAVPEIASVLDGESKRGSATEVDVYAELLEHHANNPKLIQAIRRMPRGEPTDIFMHKVVEKTFNPEVRWAAGAQLFASHRRNNRVEAMEQLAMVLSEDRYLEGVTAGNKLSARQWALNKVREIRTLGIGQELPEVFGNKLEGGEGNILDYRGQVVVLDVWTTWCGPWPDDDPSSCRADRASQGQAVQNPQREL